MPRERRSQSKTIARLPSSTKAGSPPFDEAAVIAAARAHAAGVCARLEARYRDNPLITFDEGTAEKACAFFPKFLRHSKGALAGKPFELEEWERRVVRLIFGTKWKSSGRRVIRTMYLFVGRKNGKSTYSAGLALLMLLADGEQGGEVYSAAADKDQAAIVFNEAARMRAGSQALAEVTEAFKHSIICSSLSSIYQVLSSAAETKDGLNPSAVIVDELHAHKNRRLYDVLHTAMGAREQPLEALLTTAGNDRHSICYEQHQYALRVLDGTVEDLTFLPVLFAADEKDDWRDPLSWAKANPSAGVAIKVDYLARECKKAQDTPAYQNTFRRLHLNQWCVKIGTMILMADGSLQAAETLKPGNQIIGFDETTRRLSIGTVRAAKPNGNRITYRVTTARGRSIEVTGNHHFWCRRGRSDAPRYEWVRADALATDARVAVALNAPIKTSCSLDVETAHFLGIMTGDGHCKPTSPGLTSATPEIVAFARKMARRYGIELKPRGDHPAQWRFHGPSANTKKNPIHVLLAAHGLAGKGAHTKRAPASIARGGPQAVFAFLSGYLDTDGHVAARARSIIWVSASRDLLADVQHLLALVGCQSAVRPGRKTGFLCWRLEVRDAISLTRLAEELAPLHPKKAAHLRLIRDLPRRRGPIAEDRRSFDRVTAIDVLPPSPTVGIEIADIHTHVTNGFVTHNTEQATRAIDMADWDASRGDIPWSEIEERMKGRRAYLGLDLSTTTDLTARAAVMPPEDDDGVWHVALRFFVPRENMQRRADRDGVPYPQWEREGAIQATDGNVVDWRALRSAVLESVSHFQIQEVGYDPWNATALATDLLDEGVPMVEVRQGIPSLGEATKKLLELVAAGKLHHGGHPVLRWMAANLAVKSDDNANLKPDKAASGDRIDGIVAIVIALARALQAKGGSVYEGRGLLVVG